MCVFVFVCAIVFWAFGPTPAAAAAAASTPAAAAAAAAAAPTEDSTN